MARNHEPIAPGGNAPSQAQEEMMSWKYVTDTDDAKISINLDNVTQMVRPEGKMTVISFVGTEVELCVHETPDEIMLQQPLRCL